MPQAFAKIRASLARLALCLLALAAMASPGWAQEVPEPISPINGVKVNSAYPVFTWAAVDNPVLYQISVDQYVSGKKVATHDGVVSPETSTHAGQVSSTFQWGLTDGEYRWHVKTLSGEWSSPATFTLQNDPTIPDPTAPVGPAYSDNPTYRWSQDSLAHTYTISTDEYNDSGEKVRNVFDKTIMDSDVICESGSCRVQVQALPEGTYRWHIRADSGNWSNGVEFYVGPSAAPKGLQPSTSQTTIQDNKFLFQWTEIVGTGEYTVSVDAIDEQGAKLHNEMIQTYSESDLDCDTVKCGKAIDHHFGSGWYRWYVKAGDEGSWSEGLVFHSDMY